MLGVGNQASWPWWHETWRRVTEVMNCKANQRCPESGLVWRTSSASPFQSVRKTHWTFIWVTWLPLARRSWDSEKPFTCPKPHSDGLWPGNEVRTHDRLPREPKGLNFPSLSFWWFLKNQFINYTKSINNVDAKLRLRKKGTHEDVFQKKRVLTKRIKWTCSINRNHG